MGRREACSVVLLCTAAALLAAGLPAGAQDAEQWHLVARARLGDPPTNATHQIELRTTALNTETFEPGTTARFRFDLLFRGNATPVIPGPPLQLFVYRCAETETAVDCSDAIREASEVGYLLEDDQDGVVDGIYGWQVKNGEVLNRAGLWRASVWIDGQLVNNPATFLIPVDVAPPRESLITDLVRHAFGVEGNFLERLLVFAAWIALFVLVTRFGTRLARRTVLSPRRVDPTVGRLAARLIGTVLFVIGFAFSLWVTFRVNFWAGLTALGLLSVALGFGMQNTVANIMGGISLALDKPFVIGDRIQVGETWGDVEEVGLRSTRILTTKKEYVIVPNKLMDEREIWNYTRSHQELRVDVDVGISYDSDRRLAEALMIDAARESSEVLPYPRPRVFLTEFGDFSVNLQLRSWLRHAKDARAVASDLRKSIKDRFDAHSVEIPFPYRTVVQKTELPVPRKASEDELAALRTQEQGLPRMLYATSGPEPLETVAELVTKIAGHLDMALVVLHVSRPGVPRSRIASVAYRIFSTFEDAATHHNVPIRTVERSGEVLPVIEDVIQAEKIDLVVIGSSRHHPLFLSPRHVADLTKHIRDNVKVPVLIIPRNLRVEDRTLEHYRKIVEERVTGGQKHARIEPDGAVPEAENKEPEEKNGEEERDDVKPDG